MKAIHPGFVALCAAQLGLAVPHDHRQHRHPVRAIEVTQVNTVTDIVTVTASNAVVWVDQYGVVLSTEYQDSGPGIPITRPATDVVTIPPVQSTQPPSSLPPSSSTSVPSSPPQAGGTFPSGGAGIPSSNPPAPSSSLPAVPTSANSQTSSPNPSAAPSSGLPTSSAPPQTGGEKFTGDMSGLGVCYELIDDAVKCKSRDTMNTEFGALKSQGFTKVRVYDIGCPLGDAAAAAAAQGLGLIAGINTVSNVAGDIGKLIGMLQGNWGSVDTIVVGNEVVNSNAGAVAAVVAAIGTARGLLSAAGFKGNVVTVDTFIAHANHPDLCAASDYCAVNAHAFFDTNTVASQAGDFVLNTAIAMVQKVANGKTIVITESGWPHQGSSNGAAVPSLPNQQAAIASLKSKVAGSGIGLFLFQAYDATYKQPGFLGVEQFFGIYGH